MKNTLKLSLCYLFLSLFILSVPSSYAENHHKDTPKFNISKIDSRLSFLHGKGGNIIVSHGNDGILMVDNDYPEMSAALMRSLDNFGGIARLKYVVNTHWHQDHTGNNVVLGSHANIVSHENVYKRLSSPQEVKLFNMKTKPIKPAGLPKITYSNKLNLYFNNEEISITHFPSSHTDSDSIVFFKKSNVIHLGDLYFNKMFPFIDVDNGGDVKNLILSIKIILEKINSKTIVIPGHGTLSNKQELSQYKDMLVGSVKEVQSMIDNGLTKDQAAMKGYLKNGLFGEMVSSKKIFGLV